MNRRMMLNKGNPIINNYLTMEALGDGFQALLDGNACEYCIDGSGDWISLSDGKYPPTINKGHTISFRAELVPKFRSGIGTFNTSGKFNLKGNCMSMLWGDNASNISHSLAYGFYRLFQYCDVVEVSDDFLPATELSTFCYESMFSDCESLTKAPKLPATTLEQGCYENMFCRCPKLTKAPSILPATTLDSNCYDSMFYGCYSLTTAPELPATTLVYGCYSCMFKYCTSLTTAPELPATTLADWCYSQMFSNCTSLTTAPELPATTLTEGCYRWMFDSCSRLNYIKMLATNIRASNCLLDWVDGVASSGTFVKDASTYISRGTSGIPKGWTVETDVLITYPQYTIDLKGWQQSSDVTNPDSDAYAGVYESFTNKGVSDSYAKMTITITDTSLDQFDLYIRSYADVYDYVMVSQLDRDINKNTSYSNSTLVKAHTRGKQNSGEDISDYTLVSFTNLDGEEHVINIIYRKDSSGTSGDDQGYVLIPINQ